MEDIFFKGLRDRFGDVVKLNDIVVYQPYGVKFYIYNIKDSLLQKIDQEDLDRIRCGEIVSNSDIDPDFMRTYIEQMDNCSGEFTGMLDKNNKKINVLDTVEFNHFNFGDWNHDTKEVDIEYATKIERLCVKNYSYHDKKFKYYFRDNTGRYWSLGHLKEGDFIVKKGN